MKTDKVLAVVGLGYVGLPLALAFGQKMRTIGFDLDPDKIKAYREGFDPMGESAAASFTSARELSFTLDAKELRQADFVVVAVPTPVDIAKRPDLTAVMQASAAVGENLKRGAVVIYESTVYPGVTEEICGPILEKKSGLRCGQDFKIAFSPERINPGDKEHTLERTLKVVSGMDAESLEQVAWLYGLVVTAGIYRAPSIKVAEAAKVIENTQRDLNIALMNELSLIFGMMGIDTLDVIETAGTKWNFLPFRPGLVGGHCIGVDPYYLTYKAESLGYNPQVILAGRRINDNMGAYIAQQAVKLISASGRNIHQAPVLIMGLTFKENCADLRNSKVVDIVKELKSYGANPIVWDPIADPKAARHEYEIDLVDIKTIQSASAVISAVAHKEVLAINLEQLAKIAGKGAPFLDVKSAFNRKKLEASGFTVWRL